ncbi:hypothetical protein BHE74_00013068 [Ensete ventricosum]|nr:hypothetical protein BHE74_00013068 [Ensete ventricosum]
MRPMSSSASPRGIAVIVGVGPRLGCSVARKFAHKGYSVAILARDLGKRAFLLSSSRPCASPSSSSLSLSLSAGQLSWLADEIAREAKAQVFAIRIDCGDPKSVREAFEGVLSLGSVEVLAYTACEAPPARCQPTRFTDVAVESFVRSLAESAVGAFHCAQQVSVHQQQLIHCVYLHHARQGLICVAGDSRDAGEGSRHHNLHWFFGVHSWLCRLL